MCNTTFNIETLLIRSLTRVYVYSPRTASTFNLLNFLHFFSIYCFCCCFSLFHRFSFLCVVCNRHKHMPAFSTYTIQTPLKWMRLFWFEISLYFIECTVYCAVKPWDFECIILDEILATPMWCSSEIHDFSYLTLCQYQNRFMCPKWFEMTFTFTVHRTHRQDLWKILNVCVGILFNCLHVESILSCFIYLINKYINWFSNQSYILMDIVIDSIYQYIT